MFLFGLSIKEIKNVCFDYLWKKKLKLMKKSTQEKLNPVREHNRYEG